MRPLQWTPLRTTLKLGHVLLLLRPDALLPSSHTRTVIRLLALAPTGVLELVTDLTLTSHTHRMTRTLTPTPIEELMRMTVPSLASYTLETHLHLTYHTYQASWPLTSYSYARTRFLPPTPIKELVLKAHPNPTSYAHTITRLSPSLLLRPDFHLPYLCARVTARLSTPAPIEEPVLATRPNLTSRRHHPSRRPIPQRRPHLLL